MAAIDTFRTPPFRHNCAQAVANQWKHLYNSADIVADYQPYVGGHAPEGYCGALYAAMQALPEKSQEIKAEFQRRVGACCCREIKAATGTPCQTCVALADGLVARHVGNSKTLS